jgi:DNA-binding response OmpR family regulator
MTRILIIEDNETLAQGLRTNLEFEGYAVRLAGDATSGLAVIAESHIDLVILDLMLPDQNGYDVLRLLRERGNATPVLVLTALTEEVDKVRGFRFGADDYVTKPFGLMELLARVDALLRRSQTVAAPVAMTRQKVVRFGEVTVFPATHTVERAGEIVPLRPKEYALLMALVGRDGEVASRLELLREVWGYGDSVMSRTVDTHMAELRRKLEVDPANPRYLLTVRKAGYRLERSGSLHRSDVTSHVI